MLNRQGVIASRFGKTAFFPTRLYKRFIIYEVFGTRLWKSHLTIVSFSFSTFSAMSHCCNTHFFCRASPCFLTGFLLLLAIVPSSEQRPFFQSRGGDKEKVIFHLTGLSLFLHFKSYSLDLKEKHSQRRAAKSTLTFLRGNSSFVRRDSDLFQCHILLSY